MSDPKRKIAETLADERKPRSGTLFGMAKPMSDQERALRAKIAAGGETIYAPTRRAPLEGVLNMDPFEMATGMPFSDGNEDYGALTQMAASGVSNYATPAYLQPGYEGPQTGLGPVGDAMAGLGQVFQGGNVAGPMGGPSNVLSQYAGRLPAADRAFGTAGGVKVPGRGLGKGLGDLMADEAGAARPTLEQPTRLLDQTRALGQREPMSPEQIAQLQSQRDALAAVRSQPYSVGQIATMALGGDATKAQARAFLKQAAISSDPRYTPEAIAAALDLVESSDVAAGGAAKAANQGEPMRLLHQSKALKPKG